MRTLNCFVITPSGDDPMELVLDPEYGLVRLPSNCKGDASKLSVNFQNVYKYIICAAIAQVNTAIASQDLRIEVTRGKDLSQSGSIVVQFLQRICCAEITITDVTGLNPNVLFEYGIRLSVRDSLNLLLRYRQDEKLPFDIADHRAIEYTEGPEGVNEACGKIVSAIQEGLPRLLQEKRTWESNEVIWNTVDVESGRYLERLEAKAYEPSAQLTADLANELHRLGGGNPKLRDQCWKFLEGLAETQRKNPGGRERAIEIYCLLTKLEAFREKRSDVFYTLNEICAENPDRQKEAQAYLEQAKALET
jgi:hypothetical protein